MKQIEYIHKMIRKYKLLRDFPHFVSNPKSTCVAKSIQLHMHMANVRITNHCQGPKRVLSLTFKYSYVLSRWENEDKYKSIVIDILYIKYDLIVHISRIL